MKTSLALLLAFTLLVGDNLLAKSNPNQSSVPPDPGWPRQRTNESGRLVLYQPQVDAWTGFKQLDYRMAFAFTPKGGKEIVGVAELSAQTDVDVDNHSVLLRDFQIKEVKLPGMDPAKAGALDQAVRSFLPPNHSLVMSLDELVASVEKSQAPPVVPLQNDPPTIFVSYTPAILLNVDGAPVRADIAGTNLGFIVNSNFPLFFEKKSPEEYYLYTGQQWLKSASMEKGWMSASQLPADMIKVASDPQWEQMKKPILTPSAAGKPPTVFYSNKPAEVMLFDGPPNYAKITGTELSYATNTDADVFLHAPSRQYYYLAAGRWFRAGDLNGPWTYASADLPPEFANIPTDSPAARVLVSVPGTEEAKDAVLMAQVPTTATVDPKVAEQAQVKYQGEPEFKPIEGTSLQYATNTADKVIKVGDVYYLCLQGVWFMSPKPTGPWTTAESVPKEIYKIPPSSPVYNVTYVTQTKTPEGNIQSSYTAGYLGTFVAGAILASGTGYYYPPYYGAAAGYPIYRPYAATYGAGSYYNPYSGAYGVGRGVYGPYGGAATGAAYNPYTGTYARGAAAYGPYGSRSLGQAYNPYTGTYGATRQGSNTYGSWGQSVVSQGNRSAYAQHYSNANGTVGSIQGSRGGAAVGASTKYGNAALGRTANGNMYATRDGNVYKNTGSGWQSYNNGSWNSMNNSAASKSAQAQAKNFQSSAANPAKNTQSSQRRTQAAQGRSSGIGELDREAQNRQRGAMQSQRFQQASHAGAGGFAGRAGSSDRRAGGARIGGGRRR